MYCMHLYLQISSPYTWAMPYRYIFELLNIRMLFTDWLFQFYCIHAGTYIDKKCPFAGTVSIRGRILAGTCHSAKMVRTIIVRRNYLHYVKKYQRYFPDPPTSHQSWFFFFVVLICFVSSFPLQVWEKALKHSCPHISLLSCEGRWSCYYWPMQVHDLSDSLQFLFFLFLWRKFV